MVGLVKNEWETIGWSWACGCQSGSKVGIVYDYDVTYAQAKGHADDNPTHIVRLERRQTRWVIPQTVAP